MSSVQVTSLPKTEKTFLLGVGAQKAGTTWLSYYLSSSGRTATFGNLKEYHVWDALHLPLCRTRLVSKQDSRANTDLSIRFHMQQSPGYYFDFFASLMDGQSRSLAFDITPSYAGLGSDIFKTIQSGFAARGVGTKAIFLMRDPVERCWSNVRKMSFTKSGRINVPEEEVVAHALSEAAEMRTRYDLTIAELEAAFVPEALYCGLYEEIFVLKDVSRISDFCRVDARPALLEKSVFGSPKEKPLSDDAAGQIARHYRGVYEFAAKRFPRAPDLWRSYRYL